MASTTVQAARTRRQVLKHDDGDRWSPRDRPPARRPLNVRTLEEVRQQDTRSLGPWMRLASRMTKPAEASEQGGEHGLYVHRDAPMIGLMTEYLD